MSARGTDRSASREVRAGAQVRAGAGDGVVPATAAAVAAVAAVATVAAVAAADVDAGTGPAGVGVCCGFGAGACADPG